MAGGFGPPGEFSPKAAEEEELAAAVGEEGIMAVGEGEPMKRSLTKRKAEKALSPTGEKGPLEGSATKRKAEEPAADRIMGEKKTADLMAAACGEGKLAPVAAAGADGEGAPANAADGDGKGAPAAAAGGDGKGVPAAGSMEVESSSSEEEQEEDEEGPYDFLATLSPRVLEIAMADLNIPGLGISNCFSDFYETEEEEEGETDEEDEDEEEEEEGEEEEGEGKVEVKELESDKVLETN